eukprot:bmy_17922T0
MSTNTLPQGYRMLQVFVAGDDTGGLAEKADGKQIFLWSELEEPSGPIGVHRLEEAARVLSSNAAAGWASRLTVTAGGVLVRPAESEKPCPLASPQAWRRRWFVLRRGRLSGDRDVLEYYRSQRARKPIRAIDLSECAVWKHAGPGFVRKEFQNHFVFVVKTASRTFYLVAKTEEEMQVWVHSISQVCNLGHLDDSADSVESGSRAPFCVQPSAASSLHTAPAVSSLPRDDPSTSTVATEKTGSESGFLFLPDYLILSNCETGRLHHASLPTRCDSWSNSERSLEQVSFDDVFVDGPQPLPSGNLACPSRPGNSSQEAPSTRPQAALIWTRDVNGPSRDHFSLPVLETSLNSTVQGDQNQASLPYGVKELDVMSNTPPPRPPKPSHLSERRHEEQLPCGGPSGIKKPEGAVVPRRISLSGLDNMRTWKGKCQMLNFGTETSLAPLSSLCPHEDVGPCRR